MTRWPAVWWPPVAEHGIEPAAIGGESMTHYCRAEDLAVLRGRQSHSAARRSGRHEGVRRAGAQCGAPVLFPAGRADLVLAMWNERLERGWGPARDGDGPLQPLMASR